VLKSRDTLSYGTIQGDAGLRREMSALLLGRDVEIPAEAMLVTAGTQQGIDLALRGLIGRRDVILVEEPTYPGVLEAVAYEGRRVIGIPRGASGLDLDAVERACRTHRPSLLYVVPTSGNPTGTSLPPDQCRVLLELARTYDFLILEDDVYGFLALDGKAIAPLKSRDTDGQVIYLTSLSKVLAPALRLGIVAATDAQLSALTDAKQGADMVSSMLLQRTASEYFRTGGMPAHLARVRALYRERRDAILRSLKQHLPGGTWTHPDGGLSLWVTLPQNVDERDFVRDAADEGVRVVPGRAFVTQPTQQGFMRLSYGMQNPDRIEEGVKILGSVLERHVARQGVLSVAGRSLGPLV
jgi:2-aminoadipate transaminase